MAQARLIKSVINKLTCPPGKARETFYDTDLQGFHLTVLRSGRKVYYFKWWDGERQGRKKIGVHGGLTPEEARKRAEKIRGDLSDGTAPVSRRPTKTSLTVGQLAEKYLAEGPAANPKKRASSWEADQRKLRRHIVPLLGHIDCRKLTRHEIADAQLAIIEGRTRADTKTKLRGRRIVRGGEGAAKGAIMSLSACYSWALDRELVDANPVFQVKKPKGRKLARFLSQVEAERLFAVLDEMECSEGLETAFADIVRLLLFTGARKGEIQNLEWSEVDFTHGMIALPRERSKTGERVITLGERSLTILTRRREVALQAPLGSPDLKWVFPSQKLFGPLEGMQKAWQRVRRRADLIDVRLHDLRHSFASFAAADGASLLQIGKALGHTQAQTTERYAHLTNEPVRRMVSSIEGRFISTGEKRAAE
jgi:integrase